MTAVLTLAEAAKPEHHRKGVHGANWTIEKLAQLRALWINGQSASQIAQALGPEFSRNAIIGKAHRLGLKGRPSPISHAGKSLRAPRKPRLYCARPKPRTRKPALTVIATPEPPAVSTAPLGLTLEAVQANGGCRWPTTTDGQHTWCGRQRANWRVPFSGDPQPFCPEHTARAYQKASGSLRMAESVPERMR